MNSPLSSMARWWHSRCIVRANSGNARNCEAPAVQTMVHNSGAASPELPLAGKWPDAAIKRRLAPFASDPNGSVSNVIAFDTFVVKRKLAKGVT
jgi:hypothetical protein